MNKPRLDDPVEYALIKSIHFKDDRPLDENIDPIEHNDRMESRSRNKNKSSR